MDPIYAAPHLRRLEYKVSLDEQKRIWGALDSRKDVEADRLKRHLALPDFARKERSPIREITKRILELPEFSGFDVIETPEVVPARESFDLFNFPADQPRLGNKFVEISKYPPIVRDISFVVKKDFAPNDYFDLVRDIAGDLVEQVELIDEYENEAKFGAGNKSYAYRVIYRSNDRTLTNAEVDVMHKALEKKTAEEFGATVR